MIKTVIVVLVICMIEFIVIVLASPMAKPSLVLRFLPEDVRVAGKNHPEPPKPKQIIAHILLGVFLLSMLAGIIYLGVDGIRSGYGFWKLTLRFCDSFVKMLIVKIQFQKGKR